MHVDGKNLGRFKSRAFAKYDNWSPADEDNPTTKEEDVYVRMYVHNLCTLTTQATRAILEFTKMGGGRTDNYICMYVCMYVCMHRKGFMKRRTS